MAVQPRAVPTNGIWRTVKQGSNPHSWIGSNQDDVHLGHGRGLFHSDGRSAHISSRRVLCNAWLFLTSFFSCGRLVLYLFDFFFQCRKYSLYLLTHFSHYFKYWFVRNNLTFLAKAYVKSRQDRSRFKFTWD